MQLGGESRARPALKVLVLEASRALAQLDANRLEELAGSCQALNRVLDLSNDLERATWAGEARGVSSEMAVLARVLEATQANLQVIRRLGEMRAGRAEYGPRPGRAWTSTERNDGDN